VINERRAFGERLRRHREKQHISLAEIAASTKVAASLFAGLEKGDCSRWPGGMYNRSFIRGYAAAVHLDPDDLAAEFAEYYSVAADTPAPPAIGAAPSAHRAPAAPFALRLKLDVDPEELRRRAARRAILAAMDVLVVAAIAGLTALAAGISYWVALGAFSVTYQVAVRLLSGISPAERLMARRRRAAVIAQLEEAAAEEAPVGGTASTVA
jgi:transcriptional regulator with XRE-family HTH domain